MSAHYEQGREARLSGRGMNDCPYATGGPEFVNWTQGWTDMDVSLQALDSATAAEPEVAELRREKAPFCENCGRYGVHYYPGHGFLCTAPHWLQDDDSAVGDDECPSS